LPVIWCRPILRPCAHAVKPSGTGAAGPRPRMAAERLLVLVRGCISPWGFTIYDCRLTIAPRLFRSSFFRLPSSVFRPPSSVFSLPSSVLSIGVHQCASVAVPSSLFLPPSSVFRPRSSLLSSPSASICAVCGRPFLPTCALRTSACLASSFLLQTCSPSVFISVHPWLLHLRSSFFRPPLASLASWRFVPSSIYDFRLSIAPRLFRFPFLIPPSSLLSPVPHICVHLRHLRFIPSAPRFLPRSRRPSGTPPRRPRGTQLRTEPGRPPGTGRGRG